jgi:hypothetical protein
VIVMAAIDLGTFTDAAYDRGTTTRVEVPDEGLLPPVPDSIAERVPKGTVSFGGEYGLGTHQWVEVGLTREPFFGVSLLLLYAANRSEWVCLVCESCFSAYGYLYGDHSLSGPYRVSPAMMGHVLRAYDAPSDVAPPGELERCHPDRLKPCAEPHSAPDRGGPARLQGSKSQRRRGQ